MNLMYICNQMVRMLHCYICCIHADGKIGKSFGDKADAMNPVIRDAGFRKQIFDREIRDCPVLFCEHTLIYYAVFSDGADKIVVGPVSIEKPSRELNNYVVQKHGISQKAGFQLAYCEMKVFGSAVLMFHHFLTGEEMSLDDLWRKNELKEDDVKNAMKSISTVIFERQEWGIPHNPYDQEVRELDSIRNGDLEKLSKSLKETYRGEVGQLSKNQIRQAKNIAVCVITLASRAAIEGGMLPEEAFSMVDGYILQIEEMDSPVKIDAMMRQAEFDYAAEVAKLQKNRQ